MKTEEQVKQMIENTRHEIIYGSSVLKKKHVKQRELQRERLTLQLGVLEWVMADPPAASGAATFENPDEEAKDGTEEEKV